MNYQLIDSELNAKVKTLAQLYLQPAKSQLHAPC